MGSRGRVRDPFSRRGQAEARKELSLPDSRPTVEAPGREGRAATAATSGRLPALPSGLPSRVKEIWQALLDEMVAAAVPVECIDSHAITQTARCLHASEVAEEMYEDRRSQEEGGLDPKARLAALSLAEKYGNQLLKWLDKIGATPASRVRLGIKSAPERKPSALEKILQDRAR